MPELLLHQTTTRAVTNLIAHPAHAILITAQVGSGKLCLARHLVSRLSGLPEHLLETYPYMLTLAPDGKSRSISIDAVRQLQAFTSLKLPRAHQAANSVVGRYIIIEDAHTMTIEAQNALLKLLEEPPHDTTFILTAPGGGRLLSTIASRVRELNIVQTTPEECEKYFVQVGFNSAAVKKAVALSGGLPGLSATILGSDQNQPLYIAVEQARSILQSTAYERLLLVDGLSKQKQSAQDILFVLGVMARSALKKTTSVKAAQRWKAIMRASFEASEQLEQNTQAKLVLTHFMIQI